MNVKKAMNCINFAGVLHDALAFHNAMHMITEKWFFFLFVKHCFHFLKLNQLRKWIHELKCGCKEYYARLPWA